MAEGLLSGIGDYIKTVGKPVTDALKSLTDMSAIQEVYFDVDEKATSIVKKFGQGREHILSVKQNMTDAFQEVAKIGGTFEDINSIQTDIASKLNRSVIVSKDAYSEIFAMTKVTNQTVGLITESFKNAGFSIYQSGTQMQKVVDVAREIGVSVEAVSSQVLTNMDQINRFNFQGGVEGMAKMAAQATTLRVNMNSTLQFAEKVYNPEGAIETAAALQRLGVTQAELLDPLRMMNLAQNDPTELQNQIVEMTKGFVRLGEAGNFEIMPGAKSRLYEISKAMQIPYGELTKMALGSAELEDKMKKIRFPDADQFASKETRQLIANMAEKGKGGEYMIKFTDKEGKTQEKNITQLTEKDIEILKTPPKKMEELASDQLSITGKILARIEAMTNTTGYAMAGAKTSEDIMMAEVKMYEKISDTFSKTFEVDNIRNSIDKGMQGMFDSIIKGDIIGGFKQAGDEMYTFFTKINEAFNKEAKKNWNDFLGDSNKFIQVATSLKDQLADLGNVGFTGLQNKLNEILKINTSGATELTEVNISDEVEWSEFIKMLQNLGKNRNQNAQTQQIPEEKDFSFMSRQNQTISFPNIPSIGKIKSLDQDVIEIRGGTKTEAMERREANLQDLISTVLNQNQQKNEVGQNIQPQESNVNINLTLNANISGSNVSKSDIESAFRDSAIIQQLKTELQKLSGPNNIMATNTMNKQRAIDRIIKMNN